MIKFDNIIEQWATLFKPIAHVSGETSKNKRFFRFDSIHSISPFMATLSNNVSPSVGFVSHVDGHISKGKFFNPVYRVYILVKSSVPNNDVINAAAKQEGLEIGIKLFAWLRAQKRTNPELAHIDLEDVDIQTAGPLLNGWYACNMVFGDIQTIPMCVNPDEYTTP